MQAIAANDTVADAIAAKQQGSDAFRGGDYLEAVAHYSNGIQLLLGEVPLVDYGLSEDLPPPLPLICASSNPGEALALVRVLASHP